MNSDFGVPNMNGGFGLLSEDEVLFVRAGRVLMSNPTFKTGEFLDALAQLISEGESEWSEDHEGWFGERGTRCEVLRFGNQGWQRGRVRIRLEFCPEQSPKLLRESRTPREEVYQEDIYRQDDVYRPERTRRRGSREDVYGRTTPQDDRPLYPEIDQDY